MQIFAACMECQKELGHPSFEPFFVPYYEDRIAEIKCSRGHRSVHVIQSQKFEVLLESGADALSAGFTLEACASFSAALERLHEFAVNVLAIHNKITEDTYRDMFKEMSRQSERQLGAFLVLFAMQFGSAYKPNGKIVEFRNSVIHKGFIPTPEKAFDFCSKVYTEVVKITEFLLDTVPESVDLVVSTDLKERYSKIDADLPKATNSGVMFFNLIATPKIQSFEEALTKYREAKQNLEDAIPSMTALHDALRSFEEHNRDRKPL